MRIAVPRETLPGETRVAAVPDTVRQLVAAGFTVSVQPEAGRAAGWSDEAYAEAGADLAPDPLPGADLVLSVQPLPTERVAALPAGATTVSFCPPGRLDDVRARRDAGVTTLAMELVPRISRAQAMDALTSQAMVAGYRGAIVAAGRLRQFFGLSMTAAGTVPPASVLVLGAGVAGLQAIATCKRLGAVVRGYDVRAAAAEEIRSLGALAVDLGLPTLEGAGGYAREMAAEQAARQLKLLAPYVQAADAVICTAAVPGRTAPVLVTTDTVTGMRPGSVVVDLAADSGGNVEGVVPGQALDLNGVTLWGGSNVPSQMPGPASRLYAANVTHVVRLIAGGDGSLDPGSDDEIIRGMRLTHAGEVTHAPTAEVLAA